MDDLIVLLKVLDLLHDLFENFGAVLWRIAVFYKADLDLQLQLIADVLIVQPANEDLVSIISLTFCARALHLSLMTAHRQPLYRFRINFLFPFRQKSALCSCTSDNSYNRRTRHTVPGGEPEIHRIVGILFALSEL